MADDLVHLTRQQFNQLYGNAQKGAFSQEIWDRAEDMKLGDELRSIIKKTHPNVPHPGHDEKKEVLNELHAFQKKLEDKEKAVAEKAEDDAWNSRLQSVRDAYKYTDDDMKKLDGFMRENQVANPEIAAAEMNRRSPRMSDSGDGNGMFHNYQKQDGWDEIAKNPEKWAHDQIFRAAKRQEEAEKNRRF
ncbi:MAG TPA: hypothetical protein VF778_08515 [Xanthobacteraceae bacterium]